MSLRVTVEDIETGDRDEARVEDGDYILICADPCRLTYTQVTDSGATHILTVRDRVIAATESEENT